jgi:SOS-response transcriptional repressor LexA
MNSFINSNMMISEYSTQNLYKKIKSILVEEQLSGEKKDRQLELIYNELKSRNRLGLYQDAVESAIKDVLLYEDSLAGLKAVKIKPIENLNNFELIELLSETIDIEKQFDSDNLENSNLAALLNSFGIDQNSFICNVQGESMVNASIFDGDTLIVENNKVAKSGDIVVVNINGNLFVKKFETDGKVKKFISENEKYQPYIINEDSSAKILGVVKSVIHKF